MDDEDEEKRRSTILRATDEPTPKLNPSTILDKNPEGDDVTNGLFIVSTFLGDDIGRYVEELMFFPEKVLLPEENPLPFAIFIFYNNNFTIIKAYFLYYIFTYFCFTKLTNEMVM
jgi:hypothetical protein